MARKKKNTLVIDLDAQAKEILSRAEEKGVEHTYLFMTAFERYQKHIRHLQDLQAAIEAEGAMVEKEYVKGRPNLYVNPAISAYNQTANSADKTLSALLKLLDVLDADRQDDADEFDSF